MGIPKYNLSKGYPESRSGRFDFLNHLEAFLLSGAVTLLIGGLLSDLAYLGTAEIQWKNFASWLLAGALLFLAFLILCVIVFRLKIGRVRTRGPFLILLTALFSLSLVNELIHAKDAWASMPEGPILSGVGAALSIFAMFVGYKVPRTEVVS